MSYSYTGRPRTSHLAPSPSPLRQTSTARSSSPHLQGHRRGRSDGTALSQPRLESPVAPEDANSYSDIRKALRPLKQAPQGSPVLEKPASIHTHFRSQSVENMRHDGTSSPPTATSPTKPRPLSLAISSVSRADSMRAPTRDHSSRPLSIHLERPALQSLHKSSTGHLRTLSKFAESATEDDFTIKSPEQEVVGLHGRRRLQRTDPMREKKSTSTWASRNWMDQQRQFLQAYEYLCHIGEAKEWMEDIIESELPPVVELEEALRNGVTLAEIVQAIKQQPLRIFRDPKLQYRHSNNYALFFSFLTEVELPDLFRFELIDLYEKKNVPKVIYCIHALSWLLFRKGIVDFRIGNLVGKLQFEDHELEATQKGLDKSGVSMPNFSGMQANFAIESEPEPEPEETEEDRINRELAENETVILDLQAQMRGALLRMRLGDLMQDLWDHEHLIVDLQSRIRGDWARQIAYYKLDMRRFAVNLQSAARGFVIRSRLRGREEYWRDREMQVLKVQNLFRGRKARAQVQYTKSKIQRHEHGIRQFQAAIRGALERMRVCNRFEQTRDTEPSVVHVQAMIRGALLRHQVDRDWAELKEHEPQIAQFQAVSRALLVRDQVGRDWEDLVKVEPQIVQLQAISRALLVRDKVGRDWQDLVKVEPQIAQFQAVSRALLVRDQIGRDWEDLVKVEPQITQLQAISRALLVRDQVGRDWEDLVKVEPQIAQLQAISRALLVRDQVSREWAELKQNEHQITKLQAISRALLVRDSIGRDWAELREFESQIAQLQAAARAMLLRQKMDRRQTEVVEQASQIEQLQAVSRAMLLRQSMRADQENLRQHESIVTLLQAAARAVLARKKNAEVQEQLDSPDINWPGLQSTIRANSVRSSLKQIRDELRAEEPCIVDMQAIIRARSLRFDIGITLAQLEDQEDVIVSLQAYMRGFLSRQRHFADLKALDEQVPTVLDFQSACRGFVQRQRTYETLCDLNAQEPEIVELQGFARGMLARMQIGFQLGQVEEHEEALVELQALARGMIVRQHFAEKQQFYHENMQKVIKIQSFIRGRQQGEAYKSLTSGKNPPVSTVKNFVHLLNDSDIDFDEEIEFERLRKTVVQHVRQNELAEQYIDQLDIKIALLVKNKITLDEVVKHQKHFGGHVGALLSSKDISSKDPFDLKALNKNSRRKLEHYQELFFILQTQPQYLARFFKRIREQNLAEKDTKRIEQLVMSLFGLAQKSREEYWLLKLMARSLKEEIEGCVALQDYLRGNFFWIKLFSGYIRSPRDRKFLKEVLGPVIRENIIENEHLDLESDPMQIYRSAINNEELRTGQRSRRDPNVSRDVALKDPETRGTFIHNLQDLRDVSDQFFSMLEEVLHRMPYGVRYLAQQMFEELRHQFPYEAQEHLLQITGHWVWKAYLQPALMQPQHWGVVDRGMSPVMNRNLGAVAKVLGQVAAGKLFGGEDLYLQPLNSYITEAIDRLQDIWSNLIDVRAVEAQFEIDEFNDLFARTKPTLYIKLADVFAIHNLVIDDLATLCPAHDDPLREVIRELGNAKNNENELLHVSSTEITLTLNAKFHEQEDPDAAIKSLFMETKRYILYIIRVQTGANLTEIMCKPVTPEDEDRWDAIIREELAAQTKDRSRKYNAVRSSAASTYTTDISANSVFELDYPSLKQYCLENMVQLQRAGRISPHNNYQDLLNAIAVDIRTKHRRRIQRAKELEGVRTTLAALDEKAHFLDQQLKSYNDYIEQAMVTLQSKKGKKKFLLPFTRQYNHVRELQRSGREYRFGSFKYSARNLAEKGILVSWNGYPERQWDRLDITVSSNQTGVFEIQGSQGSMMIPGAFAEVPLDGLLQAQFDNHQFMNLFGEAKDGSGSGAVRVNVNLFLHLIFKKFYQDK